MGLRVRVVGEIDISTAPRIIQHTYMADCHELDLSGVTFIDSTGLHALIRLRDALPDLRIVAVSAPVQRLLEITDTADYLGCVRATAQA